LNKDKSSILVIPFPLWYEPFLVQTFGERVRVRGKIEETSTIKEEL
jgi:hypothetical protein